ncbi:GHMP kinase [Paraburkholderia caribensis]|uniref:GHMP kinase n=2 Tax=Paraburkholderia TaxID=1822464 RepID=B2JXR9_PARP8|nr:MULTISPECIES: GHMP kinase [Paraburkholderia]ACC76427.1 GHMP kinase [Paraburkholderia phymatum STM815]MCO4879410.1 GHMP kinase [Paraburkholderia caribensis]
MQLVFKMNLGTTRRFFAASVFPIGLRETQSNGIYVMHGKQGKGEAAGHHGELLQGVFEDDTGLLRRGLVSMPYRQLKSRAEFLPNEEREVVVFPRRCEKAKRAAEITLKRFSSASVGGLLRITSNIPVARGMGSSTADVVASILAVLESLDVQLPPGDVIQIAVSAETACDSTIFSQQAVLFAQRDGIVLESFRKSIPPIDFISVTADTEQTVDTLDLHLPQYNPEEVETFRPIRALLRKAIDTSDINLLGRVATASTWLNQRFLRKPRLFDIAEIGARHGAVGIQIAHSGTVIGVMFDPAKERTTENIHLANRELIYSGFETILVTQ